MPTTEYIFIADASQVISETEKIVSSSRAADVAMTGEAASSNSVAASGKAAAAAMGDLASQKAALLAQTKNVEEAIRGETKVLADAQTAVKQLGAGHKALDTAVVESQARLAGYIQEQERLKAELGGVNTAMRQATAASQQKAAAHTGETAATRGVTTALREQTAEQRLAAATSQAQASASRAQTAETQAQIAALRLQKVEQAAANAATGEKVVIEQAAAAGSLAAARAEQALALAEIEAAAATDGATSAFMRKTNMINTGQGPLRGYDALVQALAKSMGGIPVVAALAIPLIAALAQAMFKANEETAKKIELDKEQISLDEKVHLSLKTGTLFTEEYAKVLHNREALTTQLKQSVNDLGQAELQEREHGRANVVVSREMAGATGDLQTKVGLYVYSLFASTKTEQEATAARVDANAKINDQVNYRIRLAAETGKTRDALVAELSVIIKDTDAMQGLIAALDAGALAQERFKAGQNVVSLTKTKVAEEAAAAGVTLTHAEAVRRYNEELHRQGGEAEKLGREAVIAEKNMKAFNETHHSGAAAARAYANTLVDLKQKAEDARAALNQDNFAARDAKIANDIEAERNHLEINKKDREKALQYLAARETALHDKVAQDRVVAEQRLQDEIDAIAIAGIVNDYDREVAAFNKKFERKKLDIYEEFGVTEKSEQDVLRVKKAYAEEFFRWVVDRAKKVNDDLNEANLKYEQKRAEAQLKIDEYGFKQQLKAFEQHEKEIQALMDKFGQRSGGRVSVLDVGQLDRISNRLKALGLSVKGVDERFGHATSNIRVFELRLKALEKYNKGDYFGGLRASVKAVALDMLDSGYAAEAMAGLIEDSFSNAVAAGGDFVSAFGAALVSGLTNIVAQVLGQIGAMLLAKGISDILFGISLNVNPFLPPGIGTPLIHAGTAEVAQGALFSAAAGLVKGLGGLASNSIRGDGGASGGAAAGASGGGAATSPNQTTQPRPPTIINLPTTPPPSRQGPLSLTLRLDRNLSNDLINGKGVLTRSNIRDTNHKAFQSAVKRVR